tara:strand:- start:227 stop:670 length:444 start_codon:yes stop_codon:yes gene_type:complete
MNSKENLLKLRKKQRKNLITPNEHYKILETIYNIHFFDKTHELFPFVHNVILFLKGKLNILYPMSLDMMIFKIITKPVHKDHERTHLYTFNLFKGLTSLQIPLLKVLDIMTTMSNYYNDKLLINTNIFVSNISTLTIKVKQKSLIIT